MSALPNDTNMRPGSAENALNTILLSANIDREKPDWLIWLSNIAYNMYISWKIS